MWANGSTLQPVYNGTTASTQLDTQSLPLPAPLYQLRPLPDVPYTVHVAARNALGSSGWGDAADWRAPPAGYCANRFDLPIFRDQRATLKHAIQMGLIDCAPP